MADTRLFRAIRADGTVEYCTRRSLGGKVTSDGKWQHGRVVAVAATNEEATAGWTDVTSEFIKEDN